jgi:glycosyltransferase involved in cell wall biosynthesis
MWVHVVRIRPAVLWLHNFELGGLVPLAQLARRMGIIETVVWDQHELPPPALLRSSRGRALLAYLIRRCDSVIVANEHRLNYLADHLGDVIKDRAVILDNLVDDKFADLPMGNLPAPIRAWIGKSSWILAQGGASPGRHLESLVEAVLSMNDVKLVVVGPFSNHTIELLHSRWSQDALEGSVKFVGPVPQMTLVDFIDHAPASVILYARHSANNELCSPNRLFQAVSRGTPVVTGDNPPMTAIVATYGCGVVIHGDGRDPATIRNAIQEALSRHDELRTAARAASGKMRWERQDSAFREVLGGPTEGSETARPTAT